MKSCYHLFTLFLLGASICFGQSRTDSITTVKTFGNYRYYQGEIKVEMEELRFIMRSNKQAMIELDRAQSLKRTSTVLAILGGTTLGTAFSPLISGRKPYFGLGAFGIIALMVCVPIELKHFAHIDNAMDIHNRGVSSTTFWDKTELKLGFTGNGFGVVLRF
ncbi:MAG: hypothetical protein AB8B53_15025 [Flavobacteriales bacterium]